MFIDNLLDLIQIPTLSSSCLLSLQLSANWCRRKKYTNKVRRIKKVNHIQ